MPGVRVPDDEEFRKELKEVLDKPDEWYLERVDRAVRGAVRARGRRGSRVSRKG